MTGTPPEARLAELNARAEDPNLWNDADAAQNIMRERNAARRPDHAVKRLRAGSRRRRRADRAGRGRGRRRRRSPRARRRIRAAAGRGGRAAARDAAVGRGRPQRRLSSKSTPAPAAPKARTGPACCCACTRAGRSARKYKVECSKSTDGEEAGIKSATIQIKGHNAYGWLKTESGRAPPGAHLAVRQQRPAAHQLRLASGSIRWSTTRINIEINEADCRIDTYRSSGAGGQHVNTTDFGGPHHPHSDRHRRRLPAGALAAQEPRHRLEHAEGPALRAGAAEARGAASAEAAAKTDIGWGHQIRTYVLQPYQMVKDLRTGVETPTPRPCSTATSTSSWRRRWRSASMAVKLKEMADID